MSSTSLKDTDQYTKIIHIFYTVARDKMKMTLSNEFHFH